MKKILADLLTNLGFYLLSSSFGEGYHILTRRQADNLYTNYRSKFITIDGLRIHYRDEGEGHPLVLLHGFSGSLHMWENWVEKLEGKYRIISLDLPGFGLSDIPVKKKINVAYYTAYIKAVLDNIGVKEAYFVGNSFGGWLSWEYAHRYPEMVKKLVLVAAAGYFTEETKPKTVEYVKKPVFKQLLKSGIPRFVVKRIIANSFGDKTKVTEYMINRYYGITNREGNLMSLVKVATSPIVVNPKDIRKIKQPTLIMWGTLDRIIPIKDAFKYNKDIKNSRLVVYKGVGHVPQVEAPERSLKDLLEFLENE